MRNRQMNEPNTTFSRRELLTGAVAAAAGALLGGCGDDLPGSPSLTHSPVANDLASPTTTPNGNIVAESPVSYAVYPTNDPTQDAVNVQWALDHIVPGGTVLLRQVAKQTAVLTPFAFGDDGFLRVTRDVHVTGEVSSRASLGWSEEGTTISSGRGCVFGWVSGTGGGAVVAPVSVTIRDVRFDGFSGCGINTVAARGINEISGCAFVNYHVGATLVFGVPGAFPIIVDGPAPNDITGRLTIARNYFGPPPTADAPPNNLMHVSNCDLDLDISDNTIEDMYWAGIAVFGNRGFTKIRRNDVRKTLSFLFEGVGIALGVRPRVLFRTWAYDGRAEITDNRVAIGSANTSGIMVLRYPSGQFDPQPPTPQDPEELDVIVARNVVTMAGDNQKAALACLGACTRTQWKDNIITGQGRHGILVSRSVPPFVMPLVGGAPSGNTFLDNQLAGGALRDPIDHSVKPLAPYTAGEAQVLIDTVAGGIALETNAFGPVAGANPGFPEIGVAGVWCMGHSSFIKRNDFSASDLEGWPAARHVGCIYLGAMSRDNTVHASSVFPAGTGAADQVYDAAGAANGNVIVGRT